MSSRNPATKLDVPELRLQQSLRQALDTLLHLDIPAKGRIAHHIRTGRVHRALSLCARGRVNLWEKMWDRKASAVLDQLQLLRKMEHLLRLSIDGTSPNLIGGTL